jgi:metallo-beta-lactamase class B
MYFNNTALGRISQLHPGRQLFLGLFVLCAGIMSDARAQLPPTPGDEHPQRTERIEPFKVIDNIYFVGSRMHYPAWLITGSEGHILIDTTFEEMVPDIVENISKLGFKVDDIKYLLASHAHHDHVGGHASMREIAGAMTLATAQDAEVIESGGKADFRASDYWEPAKVDRIITDLEKIRLGDIVLQAHLTPGHTKGCTTWTTQVEDQGKKLDVVILCGVRMNTGEELVGNPDYPELPAEFAYTFAKLKILPVDIYLGAHGYWFDIEVKLGKMKQNPAVNPFIDPAGYHRAVDAWEQEYLKQLKKDRGIGG